MKGTKRFAASDSTVDANDTSFRSKKMMAGSNLDGYRPESSSQKQPNAELSLDMHRAELSGQHVRALNSQFASWVQTQLKNHPDELWEDGVSDYLTHASNIMEKFSDVVSWLKAKALKGAPAAETVPTEKKLAPGTIGHENKVSQEKVGLTPATKSANLTSSWGAGVFSNNQSSGGAVGNSQSSSVFANSQGSGLFSNAQSSAKFSSSQSSGLFSNNQTSAFFSNSQSSVFFSHSQSSGSSSSNQNSGLFSSNQTSGFFSNSQSTGAFSNSQSSGVISNSQSSGPLSNVQTPFLFGGQNLVAADRNTQNDGNNDDDELPQPSSPSVKKSEEQGIVVVHEVKCKLYVKSSDPADKDAWKDKGTGHLSIKCIEGISKGTKESKPTIVIRNDVGRVLLNALLYPGIKTNTQKNSIVAIFHTSGDDGGDGSSVVARTFLIRTKTEEDRNKLATAIQEYAPAS